MIKRSKVIVAIDSDNLTRSLKLIKKIKNEVYAFKIGYEFFFNFGIDGYKKVKNITPKIFLDLKLHDIPNTVQKGIKAIQKLNPLFTTIHISGGDQMMLSSLVNKKNVKVLGVSVLTSLDDQQALKYYKEKNIKTLVKKFVKFAKKQKLDGIVCSPQEIKYIRKEVGKKFIIVTPGIRFNTLDQKDDQKRVLTPLKAIQDGSNFIVIGRPITESKNPLETLRKINKSLI